MGFVTLRSKRVYVINYHVIPYNGRWISSIVDCMHFADTREYLSISDSICHAMGDDGFNVQGIFFLVTEVINSSAIIITGTNWADSFNVGVGTTLEFSGNQQPFTVHGSGKVASTVSHSTNSRIFIFTSSVNVSLNDWICVGDTPILTIRNFTVSHNRARGVLLETRNIDIRQSVFNLH